jgi:hypothetical protein
VSSSRRPAIHTPVRAASREHRALCLLARLTPPASVSEIPQSLDWGAFEAFAIGHNLAPLVYTNLRALARDGSPVPVPAAVMTRLENDYYFSLALSTTLHAAFGAIAAALGERRIEWIPLKGLLFGRTLYRSPDVRPMTDLDFLVRPDHLDAASAALETLGYVRTIPPGRRATHEEMFERHYHRASGAFVVKVEPHSGLGQAARYRVDTAGLWKRSVPVSLHGITDWGSGARALSVEDNLAHLFLHQANGVFDEHDLRGTVDIHELVAQWRPDWEKVLARARAWRIVTPMYIALSASRALLGTPVPPEIVDAMRPGALRRAWLDRFVDTGGLGLYRFAAHPRWLKRLTVGFATMDRPSDALRYAASYAGLRLRDVRAKD